MQHAADGGLAHPLLTLPKVPSVALRGESRFLPVATRLSRLPLHLLHALHAHRAPECAPFPHLGQQFPASLTLFPGPVLLSPASPPSASIRTSLLCGTILQNASSSIILHGVTYAFQITLPSRDPKLPEVKGHVCFCYCIPSTQHSANAQSGMMERKSPYSRCGTQLLVHNECPGSIL